MGRNSAVHLTPRRSGWHLCRRLAEHKVPTRVYGYGSTALPFFIVQRTCRLAIEDPEATIGFSGHQDLRLAPRGSRTLGLSADRAVWPQRSGGQAASFWIGSKNDSSELRSNSRARPQDLGPRDHWRAHPGGIRCEGTWLVKGVAETRSRDTHDRELPRSCLRVQQRHQEPLSRQAVLVPAHDVSGGGG